MAEFVLAVGISMIFWHLVGRLVCVRGVCPGLSVFDSASVWYLWGKYSPAGPTVLPLVRLCRNGQPPLFVSLQRRHWT